MKKVLILANENERASIACIRSLYNLDAEIYLAFSDNNMKNRVIFHRYIKKGYFSYCTSSREEFINSLISIQEKTGDYYLFCFGDMLTRWVIESRPLVLEKGISFKAPELEAFDLMFKKSSFMECSVKFGLDVPAEVPVAQYLGQKSSKDKFVIKARSNITCSERILKAPILVESRGAFEKLKKLNLDLAAHFAQEYISGPGIYYCAYYETGDKKVHFAQKNICQQPGGKSVIKAIPCELPETVIRKIDGMMKALDWEGVMMIELKQSKDKFYAIECNPRFWGPLQLSIDNGVNFPAYAAGIKPDERTLHKAAFGYIWLTGYLLGLLHKIKTRTGFQSYDYQNSRRLIFKDIWLRRDTFAYVLLEPLFMAVKALRSRT